MEQLSPALQLLGPVPQLLKQACPRTGAFQQKKSLQGEACTPQPRVAPAHHKSREPQGSKEDWPQPKNIKTNKSFLKIVSKQ